VRHNGRGRALASVDRMDIVVDSDCLTHTARELIDQLTDVRSTRLRSDITNDIAIEWLIDCDPQGLLCWGLFVVEPI